MIGRLEKLLKFLDGSNMKKTSIVIPARNEAETLPLTLEKIGQAFQNKQRDYEILVVNDGSSDGTAEVVRQMSQKDQSIRLLDNQPPYGFGSAIKKGLDHYAGDYVMIAMADLSDDPKDMLKYIKQLDRGYDCCFGTRWVRGTKVEGYPALKLALNRVVNACIGLLFGIRYTDITNAFKCYTRETIEGIKPVLSRHFNITVELPLKAIVRGYSYKIVKTNWRERKKGVSKLKIQEMGSRYLFIVIYVFLEKLLCGSDYKKVRPDPEQR